jgi:hypothetical protein
MGPCAASAGEPPAAEAVFAATPPVVDGVIGEAEWTAAKPIVFPPSAEASGQSEVRLLWTEAGLFVAFRCTDKTPVFGSFKKGEPLHQEDSFEIFIDQGADQKQYFEVQVSPEADVFIKNYVLPVAPRLTEKGRLTQEYVESDLWRYDYPVPDGMKVESRYDKATGQWELEMFLPAAFVNRRGHGGPLGEKTWRINLVRHDWDKPLNAEGRKAEFLYWAAVLPGHPHLSPTLMGHLKFVRSGDKNP